MHGFKECFKCSAILPLADFYKHQGMADGHLNKCKSCARSDVKQNRTDKIDYYLEYDRSRANLPKRVSARNEYSKTAEGREASLRSNKKWKQKNRNKRAVHIVFGNWFRNNKQVKPSTCECCNQIKRLHAHHDDYAKPLDVRWLCSKCHSNWHKENGEGKNAN